MQRSVRVLVDKCTRVNITKFGVRFGPNGERFEEVVSVWVTCGRIVGGARYDLECICTMIA